MNFFGIGTTELLVILLVVIVVFGPDQLPELAKRFGKATRELRQNLNSMSDEMNTALEGKVKEDAAKRIPPITPSAELPSPPKAEETPTTTEPAAETIMPAVASNESPANVAANVVTQATAAEAAVAADQAASAAADGSNQEAQPEASTTQDQATVSTS